MTISIGIDLGTTNSVIAYMKRGRAEIIPIEGKNTFPSVLTIRNGEIVVGNQAKSRLMIAPESSVASSKRYIGTDKVYNLEGKTMTPEDVAYQILKAIKEKAEQALKEDIVDAVITVPAYFQSEQREATLSAAKRAGFNVLRLVAEPTAAALEYGINQSKDQIIMVYDLGGGTFDTSIMKVRNNEFEVLSVDGDSQLGGDDFDSKICEKIYEQIKKEKGIDLKSNNREGALAIQKITESAEKAKMELSELDETEIIIPNLLDNYNLEFKITRDEFNDLIKPIIQKTIDKVHNALKLACVTTDDIDRFILVGGSTKSPIIKEIIRKEIRDPYIAQNVDEVVACGAAIMAASLSVPDINSKRYVPDLKKPEINIKEKTVFTYGISLVETETDERVFAPIVERGAILPAEGGILGYTGLPYQENVLLEVYRGESRNLSDDEYLGELNLKIEGTSEEQIPVGAIFEIDENMIIHLTSVEIPYESEYKKIVKNAQNNKGKLNVQLVKEFIAKGKLKSIKADIDA